MGAHGESLFSGATARLASVLLVNAGKLLKIGHGLYSLAIMSRFAERLSPPGGLVILKEALNRVGIQVVPSRSTQDCNAGRSTKVPTGRVVDVTRRVD